MSSVHAFISPLVSMFLALAAQASSTVAIPSGSGTVTFEALGHPSSLRIRGTTKGLEGSFTAGADGLTGVVSIPLDSLDSGIPLRDKHMKERSLEVAKYPKAELHLKRVGALKEGARLVPGDYDFAGELSLHGVTKPVSGKLSCSKDGDGSFSYEARFDVSLKEFEIPVPAWMGITITDNVKISVQGKALPKSEVL